MAKTREQRKRGDEIEVSGARGRWVGARNGVQWIAWEGEDFATVCAAFDALRGAS